MLDVVSLLGSGWNVDDKVTVTSANQFSLSCDLPDACELKNKAKQVQSASGGYPSYAPPVGWTVYYVSKAAGSAGDPLQVEDTLWVDTNGVAYAISNCAKGVTASSDLKVVVQKKTDHTWILLAALAGLAWITFSD